MVVIFTSCNHTDWVKTEIENITINCPLNKEIDNIPAVINQARDIAGKYFNNPTLINVFCTFVHNKIDSVKLTFAYYDDNVKNSDSFIVITAKKSTFNSLFKKTGGAKAMLGEEGYGQSYIPINEYENINVSDIFDKLVVDLETYSISKLKIFSNNCLVYYKISEEEYVFDFYRNRVY
jgi:hypothetical protein